MNNETNAFEDLFNKTTDFLETKAELIQLKVVNKTSDIASSFVSRLVMGVVICLIIVLLSIGTAIWVGTMLGELYLGFFIVTGFYLLILLILYFGRNTLVKSVVKNSMIKNMLN